MPWVKLTDDFYDNPKISAVGPLGLALWVSSIAWSARNLTDGFVPQARASMLCDFTGIAEDDGTEVHWTTVAAWLVNLNLWEEIDAGYMIHDFADYQPSARQIRADRTAKQKARSEAGSWDRNNKRSTNGQQTVSEPATHREQKSNPEPEPDREPQRSKHLVVSRPNDSDAAAFIAFWAVYPRKRNKPEARRAHRAAIKRADPDDIVAGAQRWATHWEQERTEDRYIPHPGTWLNGDQWNDPPPRGKSAAEPRGFANIRRVFANAVDTTASVVNDQAATRIAVAEQYL